MPKVSVIIPVYNGGKYLKRMLDSVVNQSFRDIEAVCINDCSTDNSLEILEEYSKKENRIRNIGIDNAKGDYIYFIDADDYIDKNYLECMFQKIEHNECDIVLNMSVLTDSNGKTSEFSYPSMPEISEEGGYFDKITTIHNAPCFIWARMYRKSFLNKNHLRFLNTHADDVVFNTITTIYTNNTFVFCGENYHYTINNFGMTYQAESTNSKDLNHIKAHLMIYDFLKERNILDNRLKLFRVYPFMKVDTEEKFDFYKNFFEKIKEDFYKNENIYNEMEKYFAHSLLNSSNYDEYLKSYNKIVTIGFLRRKK